MDTTKTYEIIRFTFNSGKPSLTFETDWYFIGLVILLIILFFILKFKRKNWWNVHEMEVEISGTPKATFKVKRNSENLYVANRIYIELTTRKAAIPIDEENDVIEEIYNSWYNLFQIIRDEIKTLPGEYLKDHDPTNALIGLTTNILNKGLRPHLTLYQARFRKWYEIEKEKAENKNLSPQEIQKKYPEYDELIKSMKEVNKMLMSFSDELYYLIKGKKKKH